MIKKTIFLSLSSVFIFYTCYALDFPYRFESEYFTVYHQENVDLIDVAQRVNIGPSIYLFQDESKSIIEGSAPEDILAQSVDSLFSEVSDILDMHLYSYHGFIKICSSRKELGRVFSNIFGRELKAESFYNHAERTIYISAEGLRIGILAHEIAHAIINNFFVVLPPMKVQEVLSGYVEYSINKRIEER